MKKGIKTFLRGIFKLRFIYLLILLVYLFDFFIADKHVVESTMFFPTNDYDRIMFETAGNYEFDKVFFGNSVLTSAFKHKESESGYMNFGIVYSTIRDLKTMLDKGYLKANKDLVILINPLMLMDNLDTNPTYPWHRKKFEPYFYFHREALGSFARDYIKVCLENKSLDITNVEKKGLREKALCYGVISEEELNEGIARHKEKFWPMTMDEYEDNFKAYDELIAYCKVENIRLRIIIAAWNPYIEMPENYRSVLDRFIATSKENNIDLLDYTDEFTRDCFHDIGHFNYEHGALEFTREVDKWLVQ